jgi:hypothetical protein
MWSNGSNFQEAPQKNFEAGRMDFFEAGESVKAGNFIAPAQPADRTAASRYRAKGAPPSG